jgi:hypothetical protein
MKIDRATYLLLVGVLAGVDGCSGSNSETAASSDGGPDGSTVDAGSDGLAEAAAPCSASNPTGLCTAGTCLNGICCKTPCAAQCCATGAACVQDSAGNKSCAETCTSSSQCPASAPCCGPAVEGSPPSAWACLPIVSGQYCRCTVGSECSSGACAPLVDSQGNPVGPLVCKANDGASYDGCNGLLTYCSDPYCCVTDGHGNDFCALPCVNSSNCGAASCVSYTFSKTTCSGPTACGF